MKQLYSIVIFLLLVGGNVVGQTTWYSLNSGVWNEPRNWTLDPAGAIYVNPDNSYPGKDYTTDNVVILAGSIMVVPDGNSPYEGNTVSLNLGTITVDGVLDLRKSTSNQFFKLRGSGQLKMAGDNYPAIKSGGDDYDFISKGRDEGTVVFYGADFSITNSHTFYNVNIEVSNKLTLSGALTLNGNLNVKQGNLSIDEDIVVGGDLNVQSGAVLSVTTNNQIHNLEIFGNVLNNGTIKLTNQSNPVYNAGTTSGAVNVTMAGATNSSFTCNGVTDLYRLFINKGVDQTFKVTLFSSAEANFRLYGPNNGTSDSKALMLQNGTLVLEGELFIPTLTEGGGDFKVNTSAGLSINSSGVKVYSTARSNNETTVGGIMGTGVNTTNGGSQSFSLYGLFNITAGTFDTKSHGFVVWDEGNATVQIKGGTVLTPGFRSAGGNTGVWTYNQSGGLVQMSGDYQSDLYGSGSPTFYVKGENNVFIMSGGEMEIFDAATNENKAIEIESAEGNYSVTGGTVRIIQTNGGETFNISTTAPFYNLELAGSNTQTINVNTELTVLNNLDISANSTLFVGSNTVEIGKDLTNNGVYSKDSGQITKFIGDLSSSITGGGSGINFGYLQINKESVDTEVIFSDVMLGIYNELTINKGQLNIGSNSYTVTGNIDISKGNIVGDGALVLNGSNQTLKAKVGQDINFGNLALNNGDNGVALLSNVKVNNFSFATSGSAKVNMGEYNLTVEGSITNANSSRYFQTAGLAGNGGLTIGFLINSSSSGVIAEYPVGIKGVFQTGTNIWGYPEYSNIQRYSPVKVSTIGQNISTAGYYTVTPVYGEHPAVIEGRNSEVLAYYWKTKVTGFENLNNNVVGVTFDYDSYVDKGFVVAWLEDQDWHWGTSNLGNGNSGDLYFNYQSQNGELTKLVNGDFTAGDNNGANTPFRRIEVYYSPGNGGNYNWSNEFWTEEDGTSKSGTPEAGDIVVIRGGDRVEISKSEFHVTSYFGYEFGNLEVGMLNFEHDTTVSTNLEDLPRLTVYEDNGLNLNRVQGTGIITQYLDNVDDPVLHGDFSEFSNEKYSWFLYVGDANNIDIPETFSVYPNVMLEGGQSLTFTNDIVINRNLNPRGSTTLFLNDGADGDIFVGGDLQIGDYYQGEVKFPNSGTARTLTIEGDIDFTVSSVANGAYAPTADRKLTIQEGTGLGALEHHIELYGNIKQGVGTIDIANSDVNGVTVEFLGDQSVEFSKTANESSDFYRVILNKSVGSTVQFNSDFDLNAYTNQANKSLVLESGICHLNHPDIKLNLTTGGNAFQIPTGTTLRVSNGSIVNAAGNSGFWLDGALILDGGIANFDGTKVDINGNLSNDGTSSSFIEYTASGNSSIDVNSGGELYVGSQIRRLTTTEEGMLTFNQNSGIVEVGANGALTNTRGIFEVTGGAFTQADGDQVVIKSGVGNSVPALYFDPLSAGFNGTSGFTIEGSEVVGVNTTQPLNYLTIAGSAGCEARLLTNPLELVTLTIENNSVFNANNLDVTIKGDIINNYNSQLAYTAGSNTTYFTGSTDQSIGGSGQIWFNDVVQNISNTLSVDNSNVTIDGDLTISSGILSTGENSLAVHGDVINNSSVVSTGASKGIVLNSTSDQQYVSGTGSFGRLTIDNSLGVVTPAQSSSITIEELLQLDNGVFDIGRNLMVLSADAAFGGTFSSANMVQTNLSFTDAGIKKYFNSGVITDFIYPIGSYGKYTPVKVNISENTSSTGSIRVKAANEPHVTIADANLGRVLQYNWTLDAQDITDFKGVIEMQPIASDAKGDESKYIAARFQIDDVEVNKYTEDSYDEGSHKLVIAFTDDNLTDIDIDGDYTAGEESAIPDQIPAYISVANNNWEQPSTWDSYNPATQTPGGTPGAVGIPKGAIVYIDSEVDITQDNKIAFSTVFTDQGKLVVGSTLNHRLGNVSGTGTLVVESGSLPAGVYDEFCTVNGGTFEFSGVDKYYQFLNKRQTANNIVLSGSGTRTPTSYTDGITILGDLTIDGPTLIGQTSENINVGGDVIFTSGSYSANSNSIVLNGLTRQSITGNLSFTSANALNNLTINNANGADVDVDIELSNVLTLTNGVLDASGGGSFKITKSTSNAVTGGSESSYVDGPLLKNVVSGGSFTYPVGNSGRYGDISVSNVSASGYWSAQYFNNNPANEGYDPELTGSGLEYVSHNEYWNVMSPSSATADIIMRWDNASGVTPSQGDTISAAEWNGSLWDKVDIDINPSDSYLGGTAPLSLPMSFNTNAGGNYITFGSAIIPLYTWTGSVNSDWFTVGNWSGNTIPSGGSDVTINAASNDPIVSGATVAQTNDLIINSGGLLTLAQGSRMTVNGDVTMANDNSLIIQNDYTNPTSFINHGSISKDVQVEWDYPRYMYLYVSHCLNGVVTDDYGTVQSNAWVFSYPSYWSVPGLNSGITLTDNTKQLMGYSAYLADAKTVTTNGTMISGPQSRTLQNSWMLFGNPYASYIDLDKTSEWDFGDASTTVWYTLLSNPKFIIRATYNVSLKVGVNGGTSIISPGQSFWIRSYLAGSNFTISPGARVHSAGGLKSQRVAVDDDVFRLKLGNDNGSDEIAIVFRSIGSEAPNSFDSEKYMSDGAYIPLLYTVKGTKKMAIDVMPEITGELTVPLGYRVGSKADGMIKIIANNISQFKSNVSVLLEDTETGAMYDLRSSSIVSFESGIATNDERFVLHFKAISTDIDNNVVDDENISKVNVKVVDFNNLEISCNWDSQEKLVEIYSIDGRQIIKDQMYGDLYSRYCEVKSGLYVVKVSDDKHSYQQKIRISKH
nr:hypothetical protein [uncultured Carboxylicivirga sp.]